MIFPKIEFEVLLSELVELPSESVDAQGQALADFVPAAVDRLRAAGAPLDAEGLEALLRSDGRFLDVCRLFLGVSQDRAASMLSAALGGKPSGWASLRARMASDPRAMAEALLRLGLAEQVAAQTGRAWTLEDVLLERYRMGRGRAIAEQTRGRQLEARVREVLEEAGVPFEYNVTFTGKDGMTAKCDFAIPNRQDPKVVIEAKGFEATGSKVTDALGDIAKIERAIGRQRYFFVVLDGRGWHQRPNDLRNIVEAQRQERIDMIYTTSRLADLAAHVRHVWTNEMGG